MTGTKTLLDTIEIDLADSEGRISRTLFLDIWDNSLSRKWLPALETLLTNQYHLEKNYCWLGWANTARTPKSVCDLINASIVAINQARLGYEIQDFFSPTNTIHDGPVGDDLPGGTLISHRMNRLHRYFEDLQGVAGHMSPYYEKADDVTRWHIRQLNLLCHEYESLVLSLRKAQHAPDWQRPSQLMCWINAPRFRLDPEDYELFGVDTLARPCGGVFVGVNKAVGKHHWEVFHDEGRDSRVSELTTTVLKNQTEAAGDFDIEWGQDPGQHPWMQAELQEFRDWLLANGFDPENKALTIGHPQIGQVDLERSFDTRDHRRIWQIMEKCLDVAAIRTSRASADYPYRWDQPGYMTLQIDRIRRGC